MHQLEAVLDTKVAGHSRLFGDIVWVLFISAQAADGVCTYVGLRMFDMSELAETTLWIPVIVFAVACVVFVTFARPGWWRRLAIAALWLIPLGILLDIQFRLYQLGHSMDPAAPFTQEPFVPWVVGKVKVASNVTEIAWPGEALWCVFGAAALVTFGPMYAGFVKEFITAGQEQDTGEADEADAAGPAPANARATVSG